MKHFFKPSWICPYPCISGSVITVANNWQLPISNFVWVTVKSQALEAYHPIQVFVIWSSNLSKMFSLSGPITGLKIQLLPSGPWFSPCPPHFFFLAVAHGFSQWGFPDRSIKIKLKRLPGLYRGWRNCRGRSPSVGSSALPIGFSEKKDKQYKDSRDNLTQEH